MAIPLQVEKKETREESDLDRVKTESDSLKRPKRKDPDDSEQESLEPVPLTAEDVPTLQIQFYLPKLKTSSQFSQGNPSSFSKQTHLNLMQSP